MVLESENYYLFIKFSPMEYWLIVHYTLIYYYNTLCLKYIYIEWII